VIVPIVKEERWLEYLARVPAWEPPGSPTLVISPHPDDETLSAGGLIARLRAGGADVTVVAVTDGERAYDDGFPLAAVRETEQTCALKMLGVSEERIIRLRLPDSGVAACEARLVDLLMPLTTAETHIIAPWSGDFHPDHEACGRACTEVARRAGARLSFYFFWTWHRGAVERLDGLGLMRLPLSEDVLSAKLEALECHRSQLYHVGGSPILPPELLGPARRPFEVFLPA
jgi:LmbE family N-acetylglucosaminyl deacetylase